MQARIVRAVELARTAGNVRSADWLTRVLGFEPDAVAVPMDELSVFTSAEYLARSLFLFFTVFYGILNKEILF
jgi:hypothetical protein